MHQKKKKKIKCQWWIRRIHRWTSRDACSLDWQFWLIVDMVNALSVTGSPTTASEGSLNENRSMSETKCTLYLRFCVVSFFPLSDLYLFQYIMSLLGARESYSSFLWLYQAILVYTVVKRLRTYFNFSVIFLFLVFFQIAKPRFSNYRHCSFSFSIMCKLCVLQN